MSVKFRMASPDANTLAGLDTLKKSDTSWLRMTAFSPTCRTAVRASSVPPEMTVVLKLPCVKVKASMAETSTFVELLQTQM